MTSAMKIRDLQYITEIAETGSIGKAAGKLYVAQPSLSKCIQRVEQEYGITLFKRVKGVSVRLTPEGELFVGMAREILLSHARFQEQLKRLKELQKNTLILGLTHQRTADLAGPILEKFYFELPQQIMQIQTRDSVGLQQGILDKSLDIAVLAVTKRHEEIYYEPLLQSSFGVYLRAESPIAGKALNIEGIDYPVLRLEDLEGERFAVNIPGSASYSLVEEMLRKNGVSLEIIDVANNQSRVAMVTSGIASAFVPMNSGRTKLIGRAIQLYAIHPDQNIYYQVCLACLNGFQYRPEFRKISSILKELLNDSDRKTDRD